MGRAVRGAVARKGWTLAQTGQSIGIAERSMTRRVSGLLPFTWPELVRISEALDIELSEILDVAEREAAQIAASADGDSDPGCQVAWTSVADDGEVA
jgi:hypothetical protein